ncbi:MAG: aminotransferase class IV [Alphaproteobacteria bacterium]
MAIPNQRVAYFNGAIVPESEVVLPFRDRGVKYGDAVFDTTRTFGHRIYRLGEHLDRLYRSLRYLRIDPGLSPAEMARATEEVVDRNLPLIAKDEDYWVSQRITRGIVDDNERGAWPDWKGPTVIVECLPLPLTVRARYYRHGIDVMTSSVRRTSPGALSPRAKTHNYLNLIMADLEVQATDPAAFTVLLDENGNLCEGRGSNIFLVMDGEVLTPRERYVLPGISRQTTIDLAGQLGLPFREADLDLYDAANADEAFITSTSFCICPVRSISGQKMAETAVPGPVTKRLMDAYVQHVGFDWIAQYLRHPDTAATGPSGGR